MFPEIHSNFSSIFSDHLLLLHESGRGSAHPSLQGQVQTQYHLVNLFILNIFDHMIDVSIFCRLMTIANLNCLYSFTT